MPHFKRAVELDPGHSTANLNYGVALHETGALPDAELRLRDAVSLNPSAEARAELGRLLLTLQRPAEAVSEYEAAAGLNATRFEIVDGYGVALHSAGRYADAVRQYEAAELLRPGELRVPVNRCLALIMLGRLDEAAAALERARRLSPDHSIVRDAEAKLQSARLRVAPPQ